MKVFVVAFVFVTKKKKGHESRHFPNTFIGTSDSLLIAKCENLH